MHFLSQYQKGSDKEHDRIKPQKQRQEGCSWAAEGQGASQKCQETAQDVWEDPDEDSGLCKDQPHHAQECGGGEAEEKQCGDQEDDFKKAVREP